MGSQTATPRSTLGDAALIVFLVAQALDGVLTYIGVSLYGRHMEGNPLISWMLLTFGDGPALATAKLTAGLFGIALHVSAVHRTVALLALFSVLVAVTPWLATLLYL
jgi:uncharacterized membrane protein